MRPDEPSPGSPMAEIDDSSVPADLAAHRERIAALCLQHERALLRMLMHRGCSMQEAREIAQEAYVKLLSLDQAGAVSFLEGYFWRIAANLVIDRARARRYREARLRTLAAEPQPTYPSPEGNYIARQRIKVIERAMAALPDKCRTAFRLRVFDELPLEAVAAQMGIDVSGVKRYVARALVHCKLAVEAAETERLEKAE
jgi:RNA polymerase sigma factor (sigma-70 family)